jgi:hypothetical protein
MGHFGLSGFAGRPPLKVQSLGQVLLRVDLKSSHKAS